MSKLRPVAIFCDDVDSTNQNPPHWFDQKPVAPACVNSELAGTCSGERNRFITPDGVKWGKTPNTQMQLCA